MPKLQLSFHTTFALKKEDLLKILQVAVEKQGLDDSLANLITRTGLGNKKVQGMKSWAMRTGLVRENHLSPEGAIALAKDPYLESRVTDWLMHFYLSLGNRGIQRPPENPADWGGWAYFVYTFLPEHRTFTIDELVQHSCTIFQQETHKTIYENFRFVLRAYTEQQAIAGCQFIEKLDKERFKVRKLDLANPAIPYIIGYFLAKIWQRDFDSTISVLTEDIFNQNMGLSAVLGISNKELQDVFNLLEHCGIIEQRSAQPYMVGSKPDRQQEGKQLQIIRCWTEPLSLLKKAYKEERSTPNQPLSRVLEPFLDKDENGDLPGLQWILDNFFVIPLAA